MRMQAPTKESSGAATQEEELMRALGQLTVQSCSTMVAAPQQPASLPNLWLHKLATHVSAQWAEDDVDDRAARTNVMAVFRTCTACRDAVILSRRAVAFAPVPIRPAEWPAVLQGVCTVLRRSRKVRLIAGPYSIADDDHPKGRTHLLDWTETEPYFIHLLLCVRSKLGAAALTGIKVVALADLQQSALVPAWVRELCPSATHLMLVDTDLPSTSASCPAPVPHNSLETFVWQPCPSLDTGADPITQHARQQLAALPSLASLSARGLTWASGPALISGCLTRLVLSRNVNERTSPPLVHLPAQFPNLVELEGVRFLLVGDDDLRALLGLPHLRTLKVAALALRGSHRGGPWPQHLGLHVGTMHVDSFAQLPLDRIASCTLGGIMPTRDAARAARVAAAVRRWGAFPTRRDDGGALVRFRGNDFAALLTSLPPFLKAAPPCPVTLEIVMALNLTPGMLQQLTALLTTDIRNLRIADTRFAPGVWPVLLPSMPPSVTTLELDMNSAGGAMARMEAPALPSVEQLRSMCLGAARPVTVVVAGPGAKARVERALAGMKKKGGRAEARLVRLEGVDEFP